MLQAEDEARAHSQPVSGRKSTAVRQPALGRAVYIGVAVVVAAQASVVGRYIGHNWFYVDDFLFLRQAKDSSLTVSYLRLPLFEHFSPVHRLADWLLIRGAGPSWLVATVVLILLTASCTAAFAYLVSSVTRNGRLIVAATAFYSCSLFFIRTSIWWTAGVHIMFVTLFSMLALGGYVRWYERRSVRSLVLSLVAFELALLTHEDALLLGGFLVLLRLLVLTPHPRSLREVYRAFRDDIWVWVAYGLLNAVAFWNFATWYWQQSSHPSVGELTRYLWMAIGEGFFSTLFLVKVPEAMIAHSAVLTGVLAVTAGVIVIGFTMRRHVGAWRPWLFFLLTFLATALPLGLSRIGQFGVTIGRDPIYQLAPAFLFVFALVVALESPRRFPRPARAASGLRLERGAHIAIVGVVAIALLGVYVRAASHTEKGQFSTTATRRYFTNLRADATALAKQGIHPEVFDPLVPATIVPDWLAPFNRTAINLMVPSISTKTDRAAYLVNPDGHLQRVTKQELFGTPIPTDVATHFGWAPVADVPVGDGACMAPAAAGAGPVTVVLPEPVQGTDFVVRVDVRGAKDAQAIVYADNRAVPMTLRDGDNYAYFTGPGIAQVGIAMPASSGCIDRVAVERLTPIGSS